MKSNTINVVFITDKNYISVLSTALNSLITSNKNNQICIYILTTSDLDISKFSHLNSDSISIKIINVHDYEKKLSGLHTFKQDSICVASTAALIKFELPNILHSLDKVLYLDGDIIVRDNIRNLWETDLEGKLIAAVPESGQIYYKHEFVKKVKCYFNSGVMLLDLKSMRYLNIPSKLIEMKKRLNDSSLIDQNVFNIILDGHVKFLPLKYNMPCASLFRAYEKWTIDDINNLFKTNYSNKGDVFRDAKILHFSAKNKPWKTIDVPFIEEWETYSDTFKKHSPYYQHSRIKVSVVIPVYNSEKYIDECLHSILNQSLKEIEIICINDGSTDTSNDKLKAYERLDPRIRTFEQKNIGAGATRNKGIRLATGDFLYFMDSDDILDKSALEYLYNFASRHQLDLILFDGSSFFETQDMKEQNPQYITLYKRKNFYSGIQKGSELFKKMNKTGDLIVGPPFQFSKRDFIEKNKIRFPEGTTHEDNLFTFLVMMYAERAYYMNKTFYRRRVHSGSVMTSSNHTKKFLGMHAAALGVAEFIRAHELGKEDLDAVIFRLERFLTALKNIYFDLAKESNIHNTMTTVDSDISSIRTSLEALISSNNNILKSIKNKYTKT